MHLTIVDDNAQFLRLLEVRLKNHRNYNILCFTDPMVALDEISKKDFQTDLILVDIQMPKLNGLQMIQRIREYHSDVRIALMTSLDVDQILKIDREQYPVSDIISKTLAITDIISRIEQIVQPGSTDT